MADFGLAIMDAKPGERFTEVVGTPGYMAPELCAGEPYDCGVDVWAAGISAYEILTGRSPWISETADGLRDEVGLC